MPRKKTNINRSITKPLQLITQSYKYPFVASNKIHLDRFLEKTYRGPVKPFDLDEIGNLRQPMKLEEFLKTTHRKDNTDTRKWLRQINSYTTIQKITIVTANEMGVYMGTEDLKMLPKKQYLTLARSLSDQGITRLMRSGFCDFFNADSISEKQYYLERFTGLKNPIHATNWLGLYQKISTLNDIITNVIDKNSTDNDREFLEEEVRENVRRIMIDRKSFAYREIHDADTENSENNFLDSQKPKQLNKESLTEGYQVFGHIALCCLELLLDLDKGQLLRFCKNPDCGKPLSSDAHGNQKTCSKRDNPQCYKSWRSRAKRIERSGVRVRKNKPRRFIPSRNYN